MFLADQGMSGEESGLRLERGRVARRGAPRRKFCPELAGSAFSCSTFWNNARRRRSQVHRTSCPKIAAEDPDPLV